MPTMPHNQTSTDGLPWIESFKTDQSLIRITRFPKQFESNFWEMLDRRFAGILSTTLLLHLLFIVFMIQYAATTETVKQSEAVQERFARLVLDKSETETKPVVEEPLAIAPTGKQVARESTPTREGRPGGKSEGSVSSGGRSSGSTQAASSGPSGGRLGGSVARERAEAGRAGILGLLSSSSETASGEGVEDILGGNVASDMDKALSAGLARASSGGGRGQLDEKIGGGTGTGSGGLRGGRETGAGNIDTMVEGLGEGKSKGVARSGNIEYQESAPLIEVEEGGGGGGRSQDAVAAIVARHTAAIQSCYQSEIRRTPDLKGKIVVRFVITPQGTIESATIVSSTLNNTRVEKCVINRILRWDDFGAVAPDKGKTTIRQVYTFGY